jgi:methanogenic corrinoid protein MtbC1
MIAPMIHEIGTGWERGTITVEVEHQFTAFCEQVVDLVANKVKCQKLARQQDDRYFLMNAPGNQHTLAVRILTLWLESHGKRTRALDDQIGLAELERSLISEKPKFFLVSMSLPNQSDGVAKIAAMANELPASIRPKVMVGGYAIKVGLVSTIPGADLVADLRSISR